MLSRRRFIAGSVALGVSGRGQSAENTTLQNVVNDVHSQLNPTHVREILIPRSLQDLQEAVHAARLRHTPISIAGGRHAMGGQQFGTDTLLIDIRGLNKVGHLDSDRGIVEVEAGVEWPQLIESYLATQSGDAEWGIAQKQTGADRLTLAGTIAANAHGRGLAMKPFISDVESLTLLDSEGVLRTCNRTENAELFRLVHGGYGLFGIVTSLQLRLVRRRKLERVVEVRTADQLDSAFEQRKSQKFIYGDFQFAVDPHSEDFLHKGILSCYRPVSMETPVPEKQRELSGDNWRQLLYLAHADPSTAFKKYAEYYLSTNGQVYWSDLHQLSFYPDNYHAVIDREMHSSAAATEMITEINVPRDRLTDFLDEARQDFRWNQVKLIYGTVRLIERDDESFLPWAKQAYACTIFNLHTVHTPEGLHHSAEAFRRLIDMAVRRNGTYYLTYHRYATRPQIESCYPRFADFLRLKMKYDPKERFQTDWYRHYKVMFRDQL